MLAKSIHTYYDYSRDSFCISRTLGHIPRVLSHRARTVRDGSDQVIIQHLLPPSLSVRLGRWENFSLDDDYGNRPRHVRYWTLFQYSPASNPPNSRATLSHHCGALFSRFLPLELHCTCTFLFAPKPLIQSWKKIWHWMSAKLAEDTASKISVQLPNSHSQFRSCLKVCQSMLQPSKQHIACQALPLWVHACFRPIILKYIHREILLSAQLERGKKKLAYFTISSQCVISPGPEPSWVHRFRVWKCFSEK